MLRLLLHPLVMPIYTFALYLEIERQSYVVDYKIMIIQQVLLLAAMVCASLLPTWRTQMKSPLVNIHATIGSRIIAAIALTIVFTTSTLAINAYRTNTWGAPFILTIFIFPTLVNIMSGEAAAHISRRLANTFLARSNAAPPAYIGALSGFSIIIGIKTSSDTFWPFVISLLMIALQATFHKDDGETPPSHAPQMYWYAIGLAQAVLLMMIGF